MKEITNSRSKVIGLDIATMYLHDSFYGSIANVEFSNTITKQLLEIFYRKKVGGIRKIHPIE